MDKINSKLPQIPKLPGVYLFKDKDSNIIYIGKAVNLYNRVSSYFSKSNDIKTRAMVRKINDFECFVTANEVEALLLENNLIKTHHPRYNIKLRDAKSYPMLKITNENLPRIVKCREKKNEEEEYFGPFINVKTTKYLQKIFVEVFKIRSCNKKFMPPYKYTPCLYYHMGQCDAPCASYISEEEYLKSIDLARNILTGDTKKTIEILKNKMQSFSEALEFENAAKIRDQIKLLEEFVAFQYIDTQTGDDVDYIGYYFDFKSASIALIEERDGRIVGKKNFILTNIYDYDSVLIDFLSVYYLNINKFPAKILVQEDVEADILINALDEKFNVEVKIYKPSSSKEKRLVILAKENAEIYFEEKQYKLDMIHHLRELKKELDMDRLPRNIEGIDVATLDGKFNTGALVSFVDGKPNLSGYRQFNIEGEGHPDDFGMIEELVARRYQRLKNEGEKMPDLILIDGGKGQVSSASKILKILNLDLKIIGLAKKNEYIYFNDRSEPLVLPRESNALKLLQKIRDEAHRFSNTRLAKRYTKKNLKSKLLGINGFGEKRINLLLKKFGSINSIFNASLEDIANIEGIGESLAKKIHESLHLQN